MKRTGLHAEHTAAGARMVEFAGWDMPVQYGSIVAEHQAVRSSAALFDVGHMGEVEISGSGAAGLLARLMSNDPSRLEPGRAQYNLMVNEDGGVVDDVIVYRLADEYFMVCLNAANTAKDLDWIRIHVSDDVVLLNRSSELGLIAVQGPSAAAITSAVLPGAETLSRFGCIETAYEAGTVLIARTGYTGEDGFELFVENTCAVSLWRALLETGKEACGKDFGPAGLGARDTLRLEAALPLYGHELADDIDPYQAGLGWTVRLDRPEMVGFEALEGIVARGPRRERLGLEISGGIARQGCEVVADGKVVGVVTSGTHGPSLGRAIALALVDRESVGGELGVVVRNKTLAVKVTDLPFYVTDAAGGGS
jgi:aminomethyltransferase